MTHKILLPLLMVSLLSACSFDNKFLRPTKVPDGTKALTLKSGNDSTLVVFSADTYQPTFLKNGKDTVDLDYTIESVVFESSNGNRLNGWMVKPKDNAPTVTLIHFHGNAGYLISQFGSMAPLLKYGFQIFLFDYSGFGFSQGSATRQNVLADANSALSYVKSRPDTHRTKLVIYGQSLGGHLSAVVAQQRQSEIDGLVIEAAFSSHKDIAARSGGIFGRLFVDEKYSAYKSIKSYRKPVLVIHSTEDKVIPFKMGQRLFENANEPKEFYKIEKCHICGPRFYAGSIADKIMTMLE